ncbi:MAG: hypothetical protein IJO32_07210 [Bacilli bacterium]|nr:hypothetical protein [Bacilli bacterium]
MDKSYIFNNELSYIKNDRIKVSAKKLIELLPDYFFEIPASSTGKYHPSFSLGDGGLVRHTKVAVRIAYELLNNKSVNNYTNDEKDLIILSLILHDGLKCGIEQEKYTRIDHPLLVSKYIKDNQNKIELSNNEISYITEAIESHMGEWNKDFNNNEVLPLPKSKQSRFVHMCDYLASRKFLDVKFDLDNNILE